MGRIIINYSDEFSPESAISRVESVMRGGRISVSIDRPCYCLASKFTDGSVVLADLTRNGSDKFTVYLGER